ncbi:hypothetical protein [Streptomyces sp. NPDC006335]|uniref:hypothetical protein n=1 Tax=Streptomyces sp. NPDC006335 TaxID=3156895 RepID=UPI0033BB5C0C
MGTRAAAPGAAANDAGPRPGTDGRLLTGPVLVIPVACTPYCNGDEPVSTRVSSQALRADAGPGGADPHLGPLRTVQHR